VGAERADVVAIITADPRELEAALSKIKGDCRTQGQNAGKELRDSFKRGFGRAADLVAIGTGALFAKGARDTFEFQKRITRLGISAQQSRGDMRQLTDQVHALAIQRGLDPEQLLGSAEKFVEKTGDMKAFTVAAGDLATVLAATGAEGEDVAAVAAAMQQAMGVAGEDFGEAFDVIAMGAKKGSVEMRNFAGLMAELAPQAGLFAEKGVTGVAELSALLQMAAKGFSSAEEAGTGLRAVMDSVIRQHKDLKKEGISVYGPNGQLRSLADIIFDIGNSKLINQPSKLQAALGGRGEALRGILGILKTNGDKPREVFDSLANVAESLGTNAKDAATWADSAAGQMAKAQAKLAQTFDKTFADNLGKIASAADTLADAVELASDHAALFVATLAAAKLSGPLTNLIAVMTGASGVGGGKGGGVVGALANAAGAATDAGGGKGGVPSGSGWVAALGLGLGIEIGNTINDITEALTGSTLSSHIAEAMPYTTMDPIEAARTAQYGDARTKRFDDILDAQDRSAAFRRRMGNMDLIGDPTHYGDQYPGAAGALTDVQNIASRTNTAVLDALDAGLIAALGDERGRRIGQIASRRGESNRALQAAIGETGMGAELEGSPFLQAARIRAATATALNPLAGGGEAGFQTVVQELVRELVALRRVMQDGRAGAPGDIALAVDDPPAARHRRK
jgi:TP901 family phage tail tape measure protein